MKPLRPSLKERLFGMSPGIPRRHSPALVVGDSHLNGSDRRVPFRVCANDRDCIEAPGAFPLPIRAQFDVMCVNDLIIRAGDFFVACHGQFGSYHVDRIAIVRNAIVDCDCDELVVRRPEYVGIGRGGADDGRFIIGDGYGLDGGSLVSRAVLGGIGLSGLSGEKNES